jgi:hypothetical protein
VAKLRACSSRCCARSQRFGFFATALLQDFALGTDPERAEEVRSAVRERDQVRLARQFAEGAVRAPDLSTVPRLTPEPLTKPKARSRALSEETREAIGSNGGAP